MIEATCSACGTLNRVAETDVPAGAKFVNCASCKSRVALPVKTAGAIPSIPKPPLPKMPPPTPKAPPVTLGPPGAPVPPPAQGTATKDGIGLSDLPAPKPRMSPLGAEPASKPAPRSAIASAMEDLPAPRPPGGGAPPSLDLDDLLAGAELVAPRAQPGVSDLPAPKGRPAPAPPPVQAPGVTDLPAPKARPAPAAPRPAPPADLPAPRGGISDLPAPKPGGGSNLPMPKAQPTQQQARGIDLDLPAPKQGVDLPAPKGFFDDLPQPASGGGRGDNRPEVPAPKGFFDDLPGKPNRSADRPEVPAPKGFFDDLPQPSRNKPGDDIAPKGFFDDLPQPASGGGRSQHADSSGQIGMGALPLDLGDDAPIELAEQPSAMGGSAAPSSKGSFDDLDLSSPSAGGQTPPGPDLGEENKAVIRFGQKKPGATPAGGVATADKAPLPSLARGGPATDTPLELEEPRPGMGGQKLQPKRPKEIREDEAAKKAARAKRSKIILGVVLGVAVAGGAGFFFYQRHAAAQAKQDEIDTNLNTARKSLIAEDAQHWTRAASAASKVIELDDTNAEALGIAAEASFAGAFADGKTREARFARGRKLINDALSAGITGPALDRAQALSTLTTAPDKAVPRLQQLSAKAPKDGTLLLYLGWAQAASGDTAGAMKSFDAAMAATPSLKVLALDGRARAKLANADVEGARSDFNEILAIQKDNVAAQVGIASTLPQSQAQQQEADLLAILQRKDIKDADPRAVVAAYVLAANDALRSRRLDAARERFRKALAVEAKDISAMTGLAETELRDRKFEIANEQITKALTISPNDVKAQLIAAEIEIKLGKIDTAAERLQRLGARQPPLSKLEQVQLQIVTGRMFEARNKDEAAVDAYAAAAKLAGDFDLTPTMAAVAKLNEMSKKAEEAQNPAKQAEYKERADQLLAALNDKAQTDPQLAMTLGVAYLQNNNPEKAETYLRRVVAARPNDADALYQYGKALALLTKYTEAIEALKSARDLAPGRSEIGLELAITFERTKNDVEAGKLYDELVAKEDATIETRAHAGKYFVRTKQIPKAGEQGTKIVAADPDHAAGHYLKGEGLLAQDRADEARKEFGEAVRIERDPLYLDAQGRATELVSIERNNDLALQDQALNAYKAAIELDPLMFNPQLGAGRVYVKRREHAKALGPLIAANQIRAEDAEVGYYLGVAYQELGERAKKPTAIKWLEFSLKTRGNGDAAYRLGDLYTDPEINKGGLAQSAYRRAVKLWEADMKAAKLEKENEVKYTDALYKLGDTAEQNSDEATAKAAFEKWVVRPGANRSTARYDEVRRKLATTYKSVGPPPIDKEE